MPFDPQLVTDRAPVSRAALPLLIASVTIPYESS
jgi:hypothetical protein